MGCFDEIFHTMKCPNCGKEIDIYEQIKWAGCYQRQYHIGDKIMGAVDGEYYFATPLRPKLIANCNNCNKRFDYKVIVKNEILDEIKIID